MAGPSGVGLGLRALRCFACEDPVTDASGFLSARLSMGDSAGAPGLFCVDAVIASFGSEDATPGSRACVRVRAFLAGSGGPAFRARFGAPHLFQWPFLLLSLSARPPPGWGCPACVFSGYFSSALLCAPLVSGVPCFPALGALGLGVLWSFPPLSFVSFFFPPPRVFVCFFFLRVFLSSFFFFRAVLCAVPGWCVVGCGACWCVLLWALCFGGGRCALALCCSVPLACASPFCVVACCVVSARWRRAGGVALPLAASAGCRVVLPARPLGRLARVFVLFFCVGFVLVAPPPPRRLVVLSCVVVCRASCGVVLRSVVCLVLCPLLCGVLVFLRCVVLVRVVLLLLCSAFVRCCVLCWFFFFLRCCLPFRGAPGCFCALLVQCCAVLVCLPRCSLCAALLPLLRWLVFCVVVYCVCVFAVGPGCPLLSPGGSWWLLVSCFGGVLWWVPRCRAAPCCCALCRLALCGLVLLCLVLSCGVSCPGALSVVLGSCAFRRCVLSCLAALCVFCCGVSLVGVVRRCALCRVRPRLSCCAFPVLSSLCGVAVGPCSNLVPCSPVLCPVVLCCRVVLWCPVLLLCLVCFLPLFGLSYLKNRCNIC